MAYGSEEYYSRPRFRGSDDILSLMTGNTSAAVDQINRTGESLARSYGQMPSLLGKAVSGFVDAHNQSEERAQQMAARDLSMKRDKQALDLGDMELNDRRAESDYLNGTDSPGTGPQPSKPGDWLSQSLISQPDHGAMVLAATAPGASRRQQMLADKLKLSGLGVSQAEEGIASAQASRAAEVKRLAIAEKQANAAMANSGLQNQLTGLQIQAAKDQRAGGTLGAALTQDASMPQLGAGQAGPPRPGQVDAATAQLKAQGYNDLDIQTMLTQQKGAQAQNARERSLTDRSVDTVMAPISSRLTALQAKSSQLAPVANAIQKLDATPFYGRGSTDYNIALDQARQGIGQLSGNPEIGQKIGGMEIGAHGLQNAADQAKEAAKSGIFGPMRAQAQELLAQAMNSGNQQLISQAQQIMAGIDHNEQLLGAGANPQTHNTFQPGGGR